MSMFHLGFACDWKRRRLSTWSHTPSSLFGAFQNLPGVALTDINVAPPYAVKFLLRLAGGRLINGEAKSVTHYTAWYARWLRANFARRCPAAAELDAVLMIGDIGEPDATPYYVYLDWTMALAHRQIRESGRIPQYEMLTPAIVAKRAAFEKRCFHRAAGIFVMNSWVARSLAEDSGVPAEKIHVVHAGINVRDNTEPDAPGLDGGTRSILFIGRHFGRKGGPLVLSAFQKLAQAGAGDVELVIAGPRAWPVPGPIPAGVRFLGEASWDTLRACFRKADLFCMPSAMEGFGIVFAEALSMGVPCIGKNNSAIPDIIRHGDNGYLLEDDSVDTLAALMQRALQDDAMRRRVREQAAGCRAYYSWPRVAADMLRVMRGTKA